MLTMLRSTRRKLSTRPFGPEARAHNRGMNDAFEAGSHARFLTLADTAELLNISTNQAYALVRSGELPAIKVGGHGVWRVERSVLEAYIEGKYEETRRMGLWGQADYSGLAELSFGQPRNS